MKKLAIGLWVAQVLSAIGMLIAAAVNIESIIVSGPLLTVVGLALAIVTRPTGSWVTLLFGLSGPLLCAFCAFLIAAFRLGPGSAQGPITTVILIATLLMAPAAIPALSRIRQWPDERWRQRLYWRYSVKSLLVLMTAVCLVIVAGRTLFTLTPRSPDGPLFPTFTLVTITLSAIVVWLFLALRRRGEQ